MKPPRFWNYGSKRHPIALLLSPLALIWAAATARRLRLGAWGKLAVPVICVGNINAGGTGKTPTVIALVSLLAERGVTAHIVSRGYGGSAQGPVRVNEMDHTAELVGDEPLLMAAFGPTWVAKRRGESARAAIAAGAEVILLDDGFQNPELEKNLSVVVVDAEIGFGNGWVMPAGPLREPVNKGLARANAVVIIGDEKAQGKFENCWPQGAGPPRLKASLKPLKMGMDWNDQKVLAFAGIGRPEKFFNTLRSEGATIVASHSFADHAPYTPAVLQRLLKESRKLGAQLVTTEKDAARLPASFRREVIAFPVRLEFEDEAALLAMLSGAGIKLSK